MDMSETLTPLSELLQVVQIKPLKKPFKTYIVFEDSNTYLLTNPIYKF